MREGRLQVKVRDQWREVHQDVASIASNNYIEALLHFFESQGVKTRIMTGIRLDNIKSTPSFEATEKASYRGRQLKTLSVDTLEGQGVARKVWPTWP